MNRKRVQKLLATLEALHAGGHDDRFDMSSWFVAADGTGRGDSLDELIRWSGASRKVIATPDANCGTAACLAGWTQAVFARTKAERCLPAFDFAKAALGLSGEQAERWFYGGWRSFEKELHDLTLAHAIGFLREVLRAGDPWVTLDEAAIEAGERGELR